MPKSAEEGSARFNERISKEQQRAFYIASGYISAEADAGNNRTASAIWDELRPSTITYMTPPSLAVDVRMVGIRLNAGDIDGAQKDRRANPASERDVPRARLHVADAQHARIEHRGRACADRTRNRPDRRSERRASAMP